MAGPMVTVITVTHNSAAVIARCLDSIPGDVAVCVVDNASTDQTVKEVRRVRPNATVIENAHNAGFGSANNQGARTAERNAILFLNPDAALQPDTIEEFIGAAIRYPDAALFGPQILNQAGATETSYDADLFSRAGMPDHEGHVPGGDTSVGFLSGAALFIPDRNRDGGQHFDPHIFLFFEDDDLCLRLRQSGQSLIYVPSAKVTHISGTASPPTTRIRWRKSVHMAWSRLYLEDKYKGAGAAAKLALPQLAQSAVKGVGYALILNRQKSLRDLAKAWGTLNWLAGVRRMP